MKKLILMTVIASAISTSAVASVKEKKAMRSVDESIVKAIVKVKSACGNPALDVNVSWKDFKQMIKANKEALKSDNYKSEWVISHAGERSISTLEALSKICKEDADYKEEIANVTKIVVKPKAKFEDTKSAFSIEGTVITVESGHSMTRNLFDFIKPLKSIF